MNPLRSILWLLAWSVAFLLAVGCNYTLRLERENAQLHALVNASMVPPSTNNVRTH